MRAFGSPDEILTAIVERIRDQVPELNGVGRCYLSLHNNKAAPPASGDFFCVVSPLSGVFQPEFFEGGGQQQLMVESSIVVRIFSTAQVDPAFQDAIFLTSATRGILSIASKVLRALAAWTPLVDGDEATRDPLAPHKYVMSRNDRNFGAIDLEFKVTFDWNLA